MYLYVDSHFFTHCDYGTVVEGTGTGNKLAAAKIYRQKIKFFLEPALISRRPADYSDAGLIFTDIHKRLFKNNHNNALIMPFIALF